MGTVLVDIYTFNILAIDIASMMATLVDNKTFLAHGMSPVSKGRTEKTGTDNKIIVIHNQKFTQIRYTNRPNTLCKHRHTIINTAHRLPFLQIYKQTDELQKITPIYYDAVTGTPNATHKNLTHNKLAN